MSPLVPPMSVFSERGQIWAFGERPYVVCGTEQSRGQLSACGRGKWAGRTPPMLKLSVSSLLYCELEILSRPVELSSVPPVADLYLLYASVMPLAHTRQSLMKHIDSPLAMRTRVVPVSTMPAVEERMVSLP